MIADARAEIVNDVDEATLRTTLLSLYHLSDQDIARIRAAMQSQGLDFSGAAVGAGVITINELQQALAWLRQTRTAGSDGIIETALRQRSSNNALTIGHHHQVKACHELLIAHKPDHARSEQIRALRTELLLLNDATTRAVTVALLSPGPGEGRSLLAAELAIAFSQLSRRTLLVDADLRRPRQHVLFGAENTWGLAQALQHHEPAQVLGVEGLPHLSLLLAGPLVPSPLELLSDGRFEHLLRKFRDSFDIIVLDTPPVNRFADGIAIAALAGQVLAVSRVRLTSHRTMKEMLRRLSSTQARIVGAIINNF